MSASGKVAGKQFNGAMAHTAAGALIMLLVIYLGVLSFSLTQPNRPVFASAQPG